MSDKPDPNWFATAAGTPRWEHATREVSNTSRPHTLKSMGEAGWELVGTADNGFTLFFKRPKDGGAA